MKEKRFCESSVNNDFVMIVMVRRKLSENMQGGTYEIDFENEQI